MRLKGVSNAGINQAIKKYGSPLELYKYLSSGESVDFCLNPEDTFMVRFNNHRCFTADEIVKKIKF